MLCSLSYGNEWNKPLWTEKTSFERGDLVYFVGLCESPTERLARECSMDAARVEANKRFGFTKQDKIELKTQMTFTEKKGDMLRVYRLVYTSKEDALLYQKNTSVEVMLESHNNEIKEVIDLEKKSLNEREEKIKQREEKLKKFNREQARSTEIEREKNIRLQRELSLIKKRVTERDVIIIKVNEDSDGVTTIPDPFVDPFVGPFGERF